MAPGQLDDEAWLRREYVDKGRTREDIVAELGTSLSALDRRLIRFGIRKSKMLRAAAIPVERLEREYVKSRRSLNDLAEELGTSPTTVRRALEDAGIRVRNQRRPGELDDKDWCARHQPLGLDAIAERLECRPELVRRVMQSHGLADKGDSPYWQLADEGWQRRHYIDDGMTHAQIATVVGCSRNAVTQALHRHGIASRPTRGVLYPQLNDAAWLRAQLEGGRTQRDIAAEVGCHHTAVRRAIDRLGLRRR